MGAMKVHGGGAAAAAQQAGGSGGSRAKGSAGFSTPPGLAGRAWSELPPGIRKKVPQPRPEPAKTSAPSQASDGAAASKTPTKPTNPTEQPPVQLTVAPKVATDRPDVKLDSATDGGGPTDAELAAREATYEQYLADLSAGRTTKDKEPEGFRDWARQQLLLETGRDETMQATESALAAALSAPKPPASEDPAASTTPYNITRSPY